MRGFSNSIVCLLQRLLDNYLTEVLGTTVHVDLGGHAAIDSSMIIGSRPFIRNQGSVTDHFFEKTFGF